MGKLSEDSQLLKEVSTWDAGSTHYAWTAWQGSDLGSCRLVGCDEIRLGP
jgi:hypothetical protein